MPFAPEALVALAELVGTQLLSLRRFQALWQCPQQAQFRDIQEVLEDLCEVDLCEEPLTGAALRSSELAQVHK